MLGRFKRKLSRTKSVNSPDELVLPEKLLKEDLALSPSDEQLIIQLSSRGPEDDTEAAGQKDTSQLKPAYIVPILTNTERSVHNNVDHGILSLPTEVLIHLQQYLRPSAEVALRHSCSRFFYLFSLPSFYLAGEDKFEFICMAERDQDPSQLPRLVCGTCHDLHSKTSFPAAEVRQSPLDRTCRQVWLCAHKAVGYKKAIKTIKAGVEAPFRATNLDPCSRCREILRNRSIADRPEKGTSAADLDSPKAESLLISKIAILQAPVPAYNEKTTSGSGIYKEVFPVKSVAAALQAIDFPICSHIKLSDPYVLSRFCRSCINTQRLPPGVKGPPCISESKREFGEADYLGKCRQSCYMRGCKTKFMFQARESLAPDASGKRQVWLIFCIYRWLGALQNADGGRQWQYHIVDHNRRIEMRASWDKLEKQQRNRKPMPNWSICLLNPEDCNVRSF